MEHVIQILGATWQARAVQAPAWQIVSGSLTCTACGERILPGGGDVPHTSDCALAVYVQHGEPPTNLVCPECRGLLTP